MIYSGLLLKVRCEFVSAVGLVKNLNVSFQENSNIKKYSELDCNINRRGKVDKGQRDQFIELPNIFSNLI